MQSYGLTLPVLFSSTPVFLFHLPLYHILIKTFNYKFVLINLRKNENQK